MRLALVLLVAAAPMVSALAQPVEACTYADCGIRLEQTFFRGTRILQGSPEESVDLGGVGLFGGGLADVVKEVPLAFDHARAARRNTTRAGVLLLASAVALGIATNDIYEDPTTTDVALLVGSIGLSTVGVVFALQAQRHQSRAVWEYNRAVAGE